MNNPPPLAPKDRQQLPDPPEDQRAQAAQQTSAASSLPAPPNLPASHFPAYQLQLGTSPVAMTSLNDLNKLPLQLGGATPSSTLLASTQPKLDPINLLGAVAMQHQQQQLQNAGILRSLMDQKQKITQYEDEIRRRMMLPPSDPLLQANLFKNVPGATPLFGGGSVGLLGNLGGTLNPTLASTMAQLPSIALREEGRTLRGGVIEPFPERLHRLLLEQEEAGKADIISFIADGRAFMIHQPEKFFKQIVPHYFKHKRLSSFKRQLNLYGFELISSGPARGGYHHKDFRKDKPALARKMRRSVSSKPQAAKTRHDQRDLPQESSTSSEPKGVLLPNDNKDKTDTADDKVSAKAQPNPR